MTPPTWFMVMGATVFFGGIAAVIGVGVWSLHRLIAYLTDKWGD